MKRIYGIVSIGLVMAGIMGCSPDDPVSMAVAYEDNVTMSSGDTTIDIDVLENDIYKVATGSTLRLEINSTAEHGSAQVHMDSVKPTILYAPDDGYEGNDTFSYCVYAGNVGGCARVNITILVNGPAPVEHDLSRIVVVGDKMWENTNETIPDYNQNYELTNGKTYTGAVTYCANLELGGFDDWRIPHASWNDNYGYNTSNNELMSLRVEPLDNNGNIWHYVDNSSYDDVNESSPAIIEPFSGSITHDIAAPYWTDDNMSNDNMHVAMIFAYRLGNGDGFGNDQNLSVRCVRDIDNGDAPLVVDAGNDGTFDNSGVGSGAGVDYFPRGANVKHGSATEYQWNFADGTATTSSSSNFVLPDRDTSHALVLKVVDANGNIAWDVVHFYKTD